MTDYLSIKILLLAMLPVAELRAAIPIGIHSGAAPVTAYVLAIIGNLIPVLPILLLLEKGTDIASRFGPTGRFVDWIFKRTRRKGKLVEKYELLGLMLFVAVPLPGTGAWTGCLASHLFGLDKKKSFIVITAGVLLAGLLVTLLSVGFFKVLTVF